MDPLAWTPGRDNDVLLAADVQPSLHMRLGDQLVEMRVDRKQIESALLEHKGVEAVHGISGELEGGGEMGNRLFVAGGPEYHLWRRALSTAATTSTKSIEADSHLPLRN